MPPYPAVFLLRWGISGIFFSDWSQIVILPISASQVSEICRPTYTSIQLNLLLSKTRQQKVFLRKNILKQKTWLNFYMLETFATKAHSTIWLE
jgi:hypothetical protein